MTDRGLTFRSATMQPAMRRRTGWWQFSSLFVLFGLIVTLPYAIESSASGTFQSTAVSEQPDPGTAAVKAAGAGFGERVTRGIATGTVTSATTVGAAIAAGIIIITGSDTRSPSFNITTSFNNPQ